MKGLMRLVLPLALLCLIAGTAPAAFDYATGPGTLEYALARPDGVRVSITMAVIGRVDANGIAVHEWWDKTNPIPVLLKPTGLKVGQTIDIEGRMTTLPGGKRAVVCERIALYLDRFGYVADAVPPLKGIFEASVWPFRGWTSVSQVGGYSGMSIGTIRPLDGPGPPVGAEPPEYELDFVPGTIPWAKSLKDGDPVALIGQIVTASRGQVDDCIYIEERDRSSGIRVVTWSPVAVGDVVELTSGVMGTTLDGERVITASHVRPLCTGSLQPSGIVGRNLGGDNFIYDDGDGSGQRKVVGGIGLNNIGSLVKLWGTVTCEGQDEGGPYVYIDDGSALLDGTQTLDENENPADNVGVRVVAGSGVTLPEVDAIAELTGISSCMIPQGEEDPIRLLRIPTPVMHVKTTGNDGDGLSWENAKSTVGAAIAAAVGGQEMWVAEGIYTECITIDKELLLYGGFAGDESHRDERDWHTNTSTLDADGDGSVITCLEEAAESIIDGFTIQHGSADNGGGISCTDSSPTIAHNTIVDNSATGGTGNARGGGIYCDGGSAGITDNIIASNSAQSVSGASMGGGIYCSASSSVRILNNTIVGNDAVYPQGLSDGGGIYFDQCSPLIANNIIASNTSGIYQSDSSDTPELLNNCVYDNALYNYLGLDAGPTDISADPSFVNQQQGDYHLAANSPCVDAGDIDHVTDNADIDGDCRVMGGGIDIGADEADGCAWYTLTVSSVPAPIGGQATVTAFVFDPATGVPVENWQVNFSVIDGTLVSPAGGSGNTDSDGRITASIERSTRGCATVTVSAGTCSTQRARSVTACFYDGSPVEIFFCIDSTGSMGGMTGDHRATASVAEFLNDLVAQGIHLVRLGGVKFNDGTWPPGCNDWIDTAQFASLGAFASVGSFISTWLNNGYSPTGGDGPELQLDALHLAAADMNAHSIPDNPDRYIVLITDNQFHHSGECNSAFTKDGMITELTNTGCKVYISLWEQSADSSYLRDSVYDDMVVNAGEFEPVKRNASMEDRYPLAELRATILGEP